MTPCRTPPRACLTPPAAGQRRSMTHGWWGGAGVERAKEGRQRTKQQNGRREGWDRGTKQTKFSKEVAKVWKRDEGGGGKSISITGDTIEKAAVNYSSISGKNLPDSSIATKLKSASKKFHALGVSVIAHPMNPFCPRWKQENA